MNEKMIILNIATKVIFKKQQQLLPKTIVLRTSEYVFIRLYHFVNTRERIVKY